MIKKLFKLTHSWLTISFWICCFIGDQALLERTGYTLDVTTGQRKYGGPPPESAHSGVQPTIGTEVQPFTKRFCLSSVLHVLGQECSKFYMVFK